MLAIGVLIYLGVGLLTFLVFRVRTPAGPVPGVIAQLLAWPAPVIILTAMAVHLVLSESSQRIRDRYNK